jgi:post-segregation antitoxin (ccd killing protein)
MAQGVFDFHYLRETGQNGMTSLAGLPAWLELGQVLGLTEAIERHVRLRQASQGYSDRQMVMAGIMLNLAGGDCVDDLMRLEEDEGFCRILQRVETHGMSRAARRAQERRWRKERKQTVPSPSSMRRYLSGFCSPEEAEPRQAGVARSLAPSEGLSGLHRANADLVAGVLARNPLETVTLDQDATLIEVEKKEALMCYKGFPAFQPTNVWLAELRMMLYSEFREGNVPAGSGNLRVLQDALRLLPEGVKEVQFRSDTAAYEVDLLRYMAEGQDPRFGVIKFAVGADVTPALREEVARMAEADWKPLRRWSEKTKTWQETGQEWGEVVFVPKWAAHSLKNPAYRFVVVRECLSQQPLPGTAEQLTFPFPTMEFGSKGLYKLHAVITNHTVAGDEIVWWYRERCGRSEEAHSILKEDLAGGRLPSKYFGVNAAWWMLAVMAMNLDSAMRRLVLGKLDETWLSRRMKAVRFLVLGLPGRVVEHARDLWIRVSAGRGGNLLCAMRGLIKGLVRGAPA